MHRVMQEADIIRKKRGLSYDRIADMVGKDRTAVARQLAADANPTISTMGDYEDALGAELHLVEKEICTILQTGSLEELRIKALSQHEKIERLESELATQRELADKRLAHCIELDNQIRILNEQITEKDAQLTMMIRHITKG